MVLIKHGDAKIEQVLVSEEDNSDKAKTAAKKWVKLQDELRSEDKKSLEKS